jgi:hypothetical protein
MNTKGDLVNAAYSRGRISGLTKQPTAEDNELGLRRLETMAQEFFGRNIDVGYFFEDAPDSNTLHNIPEKYWDAFETNLAVRLLGDFGKIPIQSLLDFQRSGYSFLSASTAPQKQTQYPNRQPRGSGNYRTNRWQRYYRSIAEAPLSAETNAMLIDDIDDFVEHFDAYLREGESISSFTIEADTGLTIVSSSLSSPDISYQIQADGGSSDTENRAFYQVKIVATTSDSRQETRLINFELTDP